MKNYRATFQCLSVLTVLTFPGWFAPVRAEEIVEEIAITDLDADGLPPAWHVERDSRDAIRVKFFTADKSHPFAGVRMDMSAEMGESGRFIESADSIPVEPGRGVVFAWKWRADGLYDAKRDGSRVTTMFKLELVFIGVGTISGGETNLSTGGDARYYFRGVEPFTEDRIQTTVPDGAGRLRVKMGIARSGASPGEGAFFEAGDFKLAIK